MTKDGARSLDRLPVDRGFRLRGLAMTRIETFTDAAFAFSLTLLVISFDRLPASFEEFRQALRNIPSFAGSFATLAIFWYGHHLWSRRFGLDDGRTALLSLLLVFVMLIFVYPLRMVMSGFFHWMSGGWFPFMFESLGLEALSGIFTIYGIGFAVMSALLALHYAHALGQAHLLALDREERFIAWSELYAWLILMSVGLASALWAAFLPPLLGRWAGFAYAFLAIIMPVYSILRTRAWERLANADENRVG